jgi:hypothetical protein
MSRWSRGMVIALYRTIAAAMDAGHCVIAQRRAETAKNKAQDGTVLAAEISR